MRERSTRRSRSRRASLERGRLCRLLAASALGLALAPAAANAITGVCPDGSIFIVQEEAQIPCRAAKQVEPDEVPPMRPEYLPRPWTWQIYQQAQDPNNPYNLIDAARQIRAMRGAAGEAAGATPEEGLAAVGGEQAPETVGPLDLGLSDAELRDLYEIVSVSQDFAPASFARESADGRPVFALRLAHSQAFAARLGQAWASRGGLGASPVLVFTATADQAAEFWANLSFVQGHLSFQPDSANPAQLGLLQGRLGELAQGDWVLGYVVLPETIDLARPMDVYWNDRRLEVAFR